MFERTFTASGSGSVPFFVEGEFTKATVIVGDCHQAYAVLSTQDDSDSSGHEAIEKAVLGRDGNWEHLKVPTLPGMGGSTTVIQSGGSMYVSQSATVVSGDMSGIVIGGNFSGGDIVVNGVRITPELLKAAGAKSGFSTGVELTLHLPLRSSLRTRSKGGTFVITGEELDRMQFKNYDGSLELGVPCEELDADTYNGDVYATRRVGEAEAETYNGNILLDRLHGNGRLKSYNGNVVALCYGRGRVRAKTYNGNTDVRDMADLGSELEVDAVTRSGRNYGRTR